MSHKYYLVRANCEPEPIRKGNSLILKGVNAHNVKELNKYEDGREIYVVQDNDRDITYIENILKSKKELSIKEKFKNKWNIVFDTIYEVPNSLIILYIVEWIFCLFYGVFILFGNEMATIATAFVSLSSALFTTLISKRLKESPFSLGIGFAISVGVGFILYEMYVKNIEIMPNCMNKTNIGNIFTILSLMIMLSTSCRDTYVYYKDLVLLKSQD